MNRFLIFLFLFPLFFVSCARNKKIPTPSTIGVKTQVTQASNSLVSAKKSSEKSSVLIKKAETNSDKIAIKAARATVLVTPIIPPEKEKELNSLLKEIQILSEESSTAAKEAENQAKESRAALDSADKSLIEANKNADTLQTAINSQAQALNQAIIDGEKLKVENRKLVDKNKRMEFILGLEAAAITLFILLWLGIANFSPPYGLLILAGGPIAVYFLTRLIL